MKKRIVFAIFVLCFVWSQWADAQIRIGMTGGLNDTNFFVKEDNPFDADPNDFHNQTMGGFGAVLELPHSKYFSFRTQLMFLQRASFYKESSDLSFQYVVDYLEIPMFIKATIGRRIKPYVMAGASVGFVLRASADVTMMTVEGTTDLKPIAVMTNYSILGGGGISFDMGFGTFFIEGIYEHGIRNINQGGEVEIVLEGGVLVTENVDPLEIKTRGFQMMAGFTLPLRKPD